MVKSMNTKIMAALAVFAMVFAGFGAMAFADGNDAATGDVAIVFVDKYIAEDDAVLVGIGAPVEYVTVLDDDFEDKITILNKEYFDAMKDAGLIKGMTVTFTAMDFANEDIAQGIAIFTNAEINKLGEIIGGVDTKVVLATGQDKTAVYEIVFKDDAEAAIDIAVEDAIVGLYDDEEVQAAIDIAVAFVEAQYAGYLSPEEVQAAIDKAVAVVKESYKGYKSPAEVEKIVEDAIAEYAAAHPTKKDDTFLYVTIVLAAIVIALAGFMVFDKVIKPKMAKKDEIQVI